MERKKYDTICLSGGGINGLAFIGALYYMESNNYIESTLIKNFVGTSIGAIVCFLLALGYSIKEIYDFILIFNFKTLEIDYSIDTIFEHHGINNGNKFEHVFSNFIKNKYDVNDISFEYLYEKTKNNLLIIGTNFSKKIEDVFSYQKTPNMSIITALRISIAIPIIFTPVIYNSCFYLDGGLTNNFPINYCNQKTTLGILITPKKSDNIDIDNIISILKGSIELLVQTISKNKINSDNDVIIIDGFPYNILNFEFTYEQKKLLLEHGYECAHKFITDFENNTSKYKDMTSQTD
jgi:predicted acylesterase/phospholipase RssA